MKMELRRRALDKVYKRRDRIDMPDFQREEVWTDHQKRQLIDTILRGWHLPKFYFRQLDDATFECVDGQQRLAAIWEFFDGNLKLEQRAAKRYGGATYKQLGEEYSDAFDDFEIDIEEIEDATDDELEELFVRLQLGTPLTTAEKLNALGGEARDFAKWISKQRFFAEQIGVRDTRYAHFDIATKWLFVEARGIQPQMRFPQLEEFLRDNRSFNVSGSAAKRTKAALKYLKAALFNRSEFLRNRASVLSVCMLAARVVEANLHRGSESEFGQFLDEFFARLTVEVEKGASSKDVDLLRYQEAISYGSTSGESVRARLAVLINQLATSVPKFSPLLTGDRVAQAGMHERVKVLADEVAEHIYAHNERAAAATGDDVFKMTNKSARALKGIAKSCIDENTFGQCIDHMYYLIYEATGDCKRLPTPPPGYAMDVKFLRNQIRHDSDHGDAPSAAKKRRRGAEVLRRYVGKASLGECARAELITGQVRLLEECVAMLRNL